MLISDLRTQVAAFANREQAEFVRGGADLLLIAINRAKQFAQKAHDFEYLRSTTTVTIDPSAGAPYPTAPRLKKIERAYLNSTPGTGVLVDFSSKKALVDQNYSSVNQVDFQTESGRLINVDLYTKISLYLQGQTLKLFPYPITSYPVNCPLLLDVILWSANYTTGADTDFFLDYGEDFMLYRTVRELNVYLKQSEKIQLADSLMQDAWAAFTKWDMELASDEDFDFVEKTPVESHDK